MCENNRLNDFQFIQLQMFVIDFLNRHGLFGNLSITLSKIAISAFLYMFALCWRQIALLTTTPPVTVTGFI